MKLSESDFLEFKNHDGQDLDFHALRHTCGAWLIINGVNPKVVQQLIRHSTIKLTLDTYGHLLPDAETKAVDSLSDLLPTAQTTAVRVL